MIWIQEWSFLLLLLFKMVILYFWHFLAFCFQLGWHHHDFIHILLPQKLGINEFVKELAFTLLFIKEVAWVSLNPQIKYPKIINSDFSGLFTTRKHAIAIIILWPILSKNKKTKKIKIKLKVVKKS